MGVSSSCCYQSKIENGDKNLDSASKCRRVIDIVKPVTLERVEQKSCGSINEFKQLMDDCQEVESVAQTRLRNMPHNQSIQEQLQSGENATSSIMMEIIQMPITGCSFIDKFKDIEMKGSQSSKSSLKASQSRKRASSKPSPLASARKARPSRQTLKQLEILGLDKDKDK